jgi:alkylated DNA repair dioxygenase AlkB
MDNDYLLTVKNILSRKGLIKDKYINLLLNDPDILNNYKNIIVTPHINSELFDTLKNNGKDIITYFIKDKNLDNRLIADPESDITCSFIAYTQDIFNNLTIEGVGNRIVETILSNMYTEMKPISEPIIEKETKITEKVIEPLKKKKTHKYKDYAITVTFGEVAENHVGMEQLGKIAKNGLSLKDLQKAKEKFEELGFECELFDLVKLGDVEDIDPTPEPAYVLVIKEGIKGLLDNQEIDLEEINSELLKDEWDKKAFMRGRVVNKLARYNLNYADFSQEPNYDEKKGKVVNFKDAPLINKIRENLPNFLGDKTNKLFAEGNFYYDLKQCGIGFHGDSERKIVIAIRFGDTSIPFHYQWFQQGKPIGNRIKLKLNPGDVYVMSEKAVGTDWKKRIIPSLRHSAGCKKYLIIKEK